MYGGSMQSGIKKDCMIWQWSLRNKHDAKELTILIQRMMQMQEYQESILVLQEMLASVKEVADAPTH